MSKYGFLYDDNVIEGINKMSFSTNILEKYDNVTYHCALFAFNKNTQDEIDKMLHKNILITPKIPDEDQDKNCYVIMMGCNNKTWVNKETGEVLKRQDGIIKSENNKANPAMIYYNNWKINELTEEDMAKPDISSFEIRQ